MINNISCAQKYYAVKNSLSYASASINDAFEQIKHHIFLETLGKMGFVRKPKHKYYYRYNLIKYIFKDMQ